MPGQQDTGFSGGDQAALMGAGQGAATGAAVGGPFGALIGAGAGLFTTLLQQKTAQDAANRRDREARLAAAKQAEFRAREQGINVARAQAQGEQSALANTLAAFRSALV